MELLISPTARDVVCAASVCTRAPFSITSVLRTISSVALMTCLPVRGHPGHDAVEFFNEEIERRRKKSDFILGRDDEPFGEVALAFGNVPHPVHRVVQRTQHKPAQRQLDDDHHDE